MRQQLRKLTYHYRAGGAGGLLLGARQYLGRMVHSESEWLIYVRHLTDVPEVGKMAKRRELGFQELLNLGYLKAQAFPEEIRRRFSRRNVCHGFFSDGRLATLGWSSPDYLELDRNAYFPCESAVGLFDFITEKALRSRGHYTNALMQLAIVAQRSGFKSAYIAVDPANIPSVKGIERAGFRPAFRVVRLRRLGITQFRTLALTTGGAWELVRGRVTTQASAISIHSI